MLTWSTPQPARLPGRTGDIRLFDSSTRTLRPARPEREASLYVCGITPYDATHMGHAATYVAFDLLGRLWRDAGLDVRYVQNVTDVDDPLLERADATGVDWRALADREIALFRQDMAALRVLPPDHYRGAVESVPLVVAAVQKLLGLGLAYRVPGTGAEPDGDVYFDITGDTRFGHVARLSEEAMLQEFPEHGGDPDRPGKRHPLDPLLWRRERPGEPAWDGGSLGPGRPGWHIECAAIALEYLPTPFTVQGGGSDLLFPHHEMCAAHAEELTGRDFAELYVHTGMVGLDGEKMSKSRGNLVKVSELRARGVDPAAIRLALLDHHYRADWFWTAEGLDEAEARLAAWRTAADRAPFMPPAVLEDVRAALADDLDAPAALAAVDGWAARPSGDAVRAADVVEALLGVEL